jgi:hypothetical protein
MTTSRHYKSSKQYQSLSSYAGIHHFISIASIIFEETAYWISFLIPSDKITILHVKQMKRVTALDLDVLFHILDKDKQGEIARRKKALEQKEKEEIQAEEAIVRAILMEN